MKIELELTQEELKNLINGLNNACIAVDQVYRAAAWGCHYPARFSALFKNKTFEEVEEITKPRMEALVKLYSILIEKEEKE